MAKQTGEVGHFLPAAEGYYEADIRMPTPEQIKQFRPFEGWAFDSENAYFHDDVVNVEYADDGGFNVDIAVAFAGEIPVNSMQFKEGLDHRWRKYSENRAGTTRTKYGTKIARLYGFVEGEERAGLAFSCHIDEQGQVSQQDIDFARIKPYMLTHGRLGVHLQHGNFKAYLEAVNVLKAKRGKDIIDEVMIERGGTLKHNRSLGSIMTDEFMVLANSEVPKLMAEHNIPWVRKVQPNKGIHQNPDQNINDLKHLETSGYAYFSLEAMPHVNLGVDQHGTLTAPLWRKSDLINNAILHFIMRGGDPEDIDIEALEYWVGQINKEVLQKMRRKHKELRGRAKKKK